MKRRVKKFMENLRAVSVDRSPATEVDLKSFEKFPERVRVGLKAFAKTNDLLYSAELAGVPYTVFNSYRIKAGLEWVI